MEMLQKKDLQIIAHLRQDARMSLTNMSKKTNIPISTIFDRLKLHEGNVIKKHVSLLDFNKLGYMTRANIVLKVDRAKRDELREHLLKNPQINSVYKVNNNYDFMIEGIFKHLKEMEEFMEKLEDRFKILDKKVYYLIDDIKKEEFMADPILSQTFRIFHSYL